MSHAHTDVAWKIRLPQIQHHVLLCLADAACASCGLTWVGVSTMSERTSIKPTAVRAALKAMVASKHLRVHAYPKGGRARTTEYVVLEGFLEMFAAPCGRCEAVKKKAPSGGGFRMPGRQYPSPGGGYGEKPIARRPINPSPQLPAENGGNPQQGMELEAKNAAKSEEHPVIESLSSQEVIRETADAANHSEPPNPVPEPDTSGRAALNSIMDALGEKFGPSSRS